MYFEIDDCLTGAVVCSTSFSGTDLTAEHQAVKYLSLSEMVIDKDFMSLKTLDLDYNELCTSQ